MALNFFANTFAGNPLDRAGERRVDAAWLAEKLDAPDSLALVLWNGRLLVEKGKEGGHQIAYVPARMAHEAVGEERTLFMGLWQDTAVFAMDFEGTADPADGVLENMGKFEDLRMIALGMPAGDAGMAATAKAMFEWRRKHKFCSACGEPSVVDEGGWKRVCPACKAEHFPRTDPVVIMLATHNGRGMLGRQNIWPAGMFSALAGFVEPGESMEEACARELMEEAGLKTLSVRYHSTQPWPYPNSLMIGLIAEVEDDQATPDQTELSEVRWFTKSEMLDLLDGKVEKTFAPGAMAIAHQIIRAWATEPD